MEDDATVVAHVLVHHGPGEEEVFTHHHSQEALAGPPVTPHPLPHIPTSHTMSLVSGAASS